MKEQQREKKKKKNPRKLLIKNAMLSVFMIVSMLFIGGVANFSLAISDKAFAPGVSVDGFNVSKMTYKQAQDLLTDYSQRLHAKAKLNLIYKGNKTEFSADQLGIRLNFEQDLQEAFNYDKNAGDSSIQRYDKTRALAKGVNFGQGFFDRDKLMATLQAYVKDISTTASDASVSVDKQNHSLAFTNESSGEEIDVEELTNIILTKINKEDFSDLIVTSKASFPKVSRDFLASNTILIGECETKAVNNANRNTNIQLICDTINGERIESGEVFSVNMLIGERTVEKGFKPAPAIVDGNSLKDQIGGGICQVAGTLYNAALSANMEIIERVRHSWPSSYLPIGLDATLNWDNKDLKIKNTSDMPIYVIAYFDKQKVRVQLYGKPLADGVTIEVQNEVTEIIPYNTEIQYTKELPSGQSKLISSPRQGYKVNVYRVFIKNGAVLQRQLISQDRYAPVDKVLLVGTSINKD